MSTPAPVAVPPNTPQRIDPDGDYHKRPAALLKMELEARRDDIRHHLEGLRNELTSVQGVTADGRPLPEALAEKAVKVAGAALAVGLTLGLLTGIRKHRKNVPELSDLDLVRARAQSLIDAAALRVARGADTDDAIARTLRTTPIVVADQRAPREHRGPSVMEGVASTLFGMALKVAADKLTQRLTPHEETLAALEDAAD